MIYLVLIVLFVLIPLVTLQYDKNFKDDWKTYKFGVLNLIIPALVSFILSTIMFLTVLCLVLVNLILMSYGSGFITAQVEKILGISAILEFLILTFIYLLMHIVDRKFYTKKLIKYVKENYDKENKKWQLAEITREAQIFSFKDIQKTIKEIDSNRL